MTLAGPRGEFAGQVQGDTYLKFSDDKSPVTLYTASTAGSPPKARGLWGLPKEREEDDLHHALDVRLGGRQCRRT